MLLVFPIPLPPRPSGEEKGSGFPFSLVSHGQEINSVRDILYRVRWVCLLTCLLCFSIFQPSPISLPLFPSGSLSLYN